MMMSKEHPTASSALKRHIFEEASPLAAEGSAKPSEEYARTVVSISSSAAGKFGPRTEGETLVPIICRMNQGQERTCAEAVI
jgi:hypothetical protein